MSNQSISREPDAVERTFDKAALTDRERDSARSLLQGMSAQVAAEAMGVSPSSVGSYRSRAYEKLGVGSGRELIALRESLSEPMGIEGLKGRLREKGLGETQANVCALIAAGKTTSEIASELGIATGTVNSARAYGYRLLHVHSREELVELLKKDGRDGAEPMPDGTRKRRWVFVGAAAALAVVVLSVLGCMGVLVTDLSASQGVQAVTRGADAVPFTAVSDDGTALFGVNESGQRFGRRDWVAAFMGGIADLYAAEGEGGETGYAPQDAKPGSPLYDADGKTEVGTFSLFEWQVNDLGVERLDPGETSFTAYGSDGNALFGVNGAGQRFGSREFADLYLGGKLDLEATTASNGAHGYVYVGDVETKPVLTVYAQDGVTELGTLASG